VLLYCFLNLFPILFIDPVKLPRLPTSFVDLADSPFFIILFNATKAATLAPVAAPAFIRTFLLKKPLPLFFRLRLLLLTTIY